MIANERTQRLREIMNAPISDPDKMIRYLELCIEDLQEENHKLLEALIRASNK